MDEVGLQSQSVSCSSNNSHFSLCWTQQDHLSSSESMSSVRKVSAKVVALIARTTPLTMHMHSTTSAMHMTPKTERCWWRTSPWQLMIIMMLLRHLVSVYILSLPLPRPFTITVMMLAALHHHCTLAFVLRALDTSSQIHEGPLVALCLYGWSTLTHTGPTASELVSFCSHSNAAVLTGQWTESHPS